MTTTKKMPTGLGITAGFLAKHLDSHFILKSEVAARLIAAPALQTARTGQFCTETARVQQQPDAEWIAEYDADDLLVQPPVSAIIRPGAEYTKTKASNLYVNEVFPRPEFNVLDVGRHYPQGRAHRFGGVFKPHVHSSDLNNQRMVFEIPKGIKAMNSTTTGQTAPTQNPDHTSLSFIKIEHKGPRKQRLTNWFNVPDQDYCSGNTTGYRVAAELMAWLQTRQASYENGMIVREIMLAAFAVLSEPSSHGKPDRRGAAVTFCDSMTAFVMFSASKADHQAYLAGRVQRSSDWAKKSAQMDAERNRQTGLRLAAARKAKREARAMEAGAA